MSKLTDKEKEIVLMLREIEDDEILIISSILVASEDNTTNDLYDYLIENPNADSSDVLNFLISGKDD